MIQVTDEMVQLIYGRIDFVNHGDDGIREGLADVLAIVERDCVLPAVESAAKEVLALIERDYRLDRICRDELMPGVHCARPAHVRGEHEAAMGPGRSVKWS